MQRYVGLDVSVKETSVCIIDKAGKVAVHRRQFVVGRELGHSRALRHEYSLGKHVEIIVVPLA